MDKIYLENLLNTFQFDTLEKALSELPFEEMDDMLNQLACNTTTDESNLLVYTFLLTMLAKNETSKLHLLTSRLMATSLNYINQAENIGLYHGLRALELDPENINICEYLLYFNHIPERLLDNATAISLAKRVLEKNPGSLAAKITLPITK